MRNAIALLSIIFLISVALFFLNKSEEPEHFVSRDSFMENVKLVHVTSETVDWTAEIEKVVIDSSKNESIINSIMFTFHENNVTAYADHGLYDMISDDLSLSEHVSARKDGLDIKIDSIFWDADKRSLSSDSYVQIKGESIFVEGTGLTITDDGKMTIKKNIRAITH
jgi:hypothetical protein